MRPMHGQRGGAWLRPGDLSGMRWLGPDPARCAVVLRPGRHDGDMPDLRGGRRGDQYVVVQVVIPKDLDPEQKALLRKVGGLTGKPEKVPKSFFDKLRNAISLD